MKKLTILLLALYLISPATAKPDKPTRLSGTGSPPITQLTDRPIGRTVIITAYCPCAKCCDKMTGITASGAKATQGVTVATDWNVYPCGTVLYIEGVGERIVQDVGGSIRGNRIDLYFQSHEDALKFGRKEAVIYVQSRG